MALIKCRECEREISSEAKVCPHCGCPMVKKKLGEKVTLTREQKIGIVVLILFLIFVVWQVAAAKWSEKQFYETAPDIFFSNVSKR